MSELKQASLAPVADSARIGVMDILRGFALVGILLMNIEWFNRSGTDIRTFDTSLTGLDHAVGWLVRAFVEGKFYKLFALLFGMGFAVMLLRAKEVGRPFWAWFVRRMLVLLLIGLVHNVFLWDGDILHDYAFAGLVLLGWVWLFETRWLRRFNTPAVFLAVGLVWLAAPLMVKSVAGINYGTQTTDAELRQQWQFDLDVAAGVNERLAAEAANEADTTPARSDSETNADDDLAVEDRLEREIQYWVGKERGWARRAETQVAIMSGDSYLAAVRYRAAQLPADAVKTLFFTAVLLMPIFLVGYWFVASGVLKHHREHKLLFRSLASIGIGFGTVLSVAGLLMLQHPIEETSELLWQIAFWLFNLGQLVLAAGYLGVVVLLVGPPAGHAVLKPLVPFGRMALTNYIMQSVILVLLFHGYAGGLYGSVPRAQQMLVVVAIVVIQILYSSWWLKHFRFGPLEWLWRSATYMSWQPLRR